MEPLDFFFFSLVYSLGVRPRTPYEFMTRRPEGTPVTLVLSLSRFVHFCRQKMFQGTSQVQIRSISGVFWFGCTLDWNHSRWEEVTRWFQFFGLFY